MKKHGGLLHLESTSPSGSIFTFYLPAANGRAVLPEVVGSEPPARFERQRILVMDDDDAVRELTSELLGTLGFQVTAVPDGAAAVKTYECARQSGEDFHAVILDATIRGGMGGVATIEHLRKVDPGVTAIICSGYSNESALSEFMNYGFRGALPKPFTRHELANVLQRAFEADKVETAKPA